MAPVHVVLALNNSEHSKYAFNWVVKNLLRTSDHKLTILTVVEPPIQAGYYYAASAGTFNYTGHSIVFLSGVLFAGVAMYSPSFIDEVYKKAQEDATNLVREYQAELEKVFDVSVVLGPILIVLIRARCHVKW